MMCVLVWLLSVVIDGGGAVAVGVVGDPGAADGRTLDPWVWSLLEVVAIVSFRTVIVVYIREGGEGPFCCVCVKLAGSR